jgi:hypothetical protein
MDIINIFGIYDLLTSVMVGIICIHVVVVNVTMRKVLKEILELKKIRKQEFGV